MSPRVPGNKPAEVSEESASAAILEALEANARAANAAASAAPERGRMAPRRLRLQVRPETWPKHCA